MYFGNETIKESNLVIFKESFEEVSNEEVLTEADAVRKAVLKDSCKIVTGFLNSNGINLESRKAFRNRDFKKGDSNEIKFCFAAKAGTSIAIGLLFSVFVQLVYMYYVEAKYLPQIKKLFSDKKNIAELNEELKEVGNVKVKGYSSSKNELTLVYSE